MKIELSAPARKSLKAIQRYTKKQWGQKQQKKYIKNFYDTFQNLVQNPKLGKQCDDIILGLRSYPEGSHVIYYRIKKNYIEIADILHERMEPKSTSKLN